MALAVYSGANLVQAAEPSPLAVPAEFIRNIRMPGFGETILRPSALHYDRFHGEVLVGDSGNNRILIFTAAGVYKFSFPLAEIMNIPRDITTDPEGYIYILGTGAAGQVVARFDFDGTPIGTLAIPTELNGIGTDLRYLACDEFGTLYVLDHSGRRVLVVGENDTIVNVIGLERDADVQSLISDGTAGGKGAYALGTMACNGTTLYIPVSNRGTIETFSTTGQYLGSVGYFGSKPGTLNFPVAIEVSPDGVVMVLDRGRYCIVCYSGSGEFLGEFGGKGISPGWFMGPSLLSVPSAGRAIVGQVYRNKIQVCAVPDFIRAKAKRIFSEQAAMVPDLSGSFVAVSTDIDVAQRRLSNNDRSQQPRDGDSSPSNHHNAHDVPTLSSPEVSE